MSVTLDTLVLQGHVVPHLKALMYGYLEPEAQQRGSHFNMYHALLKIGVLEGKMRLYYIAIQCFDIESRKFVFL